MFGTKESIILTLIQPGKGRFTLAYMSHDYLHGSHAGLPGWIRGKSLLEEQSILSKQRGIFKKNN